MERRNIIHGQINISADVNTLRGEVKVVPFNNLFVFKYGIQRILEFQLKLKPEYKCIINVIPAARVNYILGLGLYYQPF